MTTTQEIGKGRYCGQNITWKGKQGNNYNKAIFVKFQQQLRETTGLQIDTLQSEQAYEVYIDTNMNVQPYRL